MFAQKRSFVPFLCPFADSHLRSLRSLILRSFRKRKMRTKFFLHKLFEHRQGSGTSRQNSRDIPDSSLRNPRSLGQGRQSFEGGHEVFGHHPFAWKTPTPPGGLRTQELNLCALFFLPDLLRSLILRSFALICVFLRLTAFRTTVLGNFRISLRSENNATFAFGGLSH